MSNILTEDTNRRIERDLIGMGQKRLGKCPFISDPDLSSQNLPSLWGVLQKFRFPTEQDKKLLETVHKLHPTSVAKYKDLRKVLQWAPLKYSIFKSNIAETKRKDETTWIPISMDDNTNETTFPPPKISAIGLAKQRQDMTQDVTRNRLLGPIIAQRNNTTQQQQHPIPIALHPKLTNRIIQVSIDKETKAQNAQQLVFSNDCKHRTGILILATAKSEFEMLESLKVKHKQMAKSRSLVKSNVEGVNTGSVEKELAHWFMKKKHLDFHAERFGFSHKRITGAVGGAVPIDIDSLS
ncbi:hypothetical protein BDR26DRAFT_871332 [Obelidium mucronatum]|nr:hypothetical protein BDR26DRAFT_871332 [Obelidium mucronatum]